MGVRAGLEVGEGGVSGGAGEVVVGGGEGGAGSR